MEDRSKVEEIVLCQELRFKDSTELYKKLFYREAIKHPAKCNLFLLFYLIRKYTKEGDMILDPMCGSGSTGLIACMLKRKAILIDIEPRYIEWTVKTFRKYPHFKPFILRGDVRELRKGLGLLGNPIIDAIIFSPPYADMLKSVQMIDGGYSYSKKQIGRLPLKPYLSEMSKVYRECYVVLKPKGKMILILRNYIRKRGVVDLVYETYQLCSSIGFKLVEGMKFRLPKIRRELIEYYKANLLVPRILHEYILVFRRIFRVLGKMGLFREAD